MITTTVKCDRCGMTDTGNNFHILYIGLAKFCLSGFPPIVHPSERGDFCPACTDTLLKVFRFSTWRPEYHGPGELPNTGVFNRTYDSLTKWREGRKKW